MHSKRRRQQIESTQYDIQYTHTDHSQLQKSNQIKQNKQKTIFI